MSAETPLQARSEAAWVQVARHRVVACSRAFADLVGRPATDLVGTNISHLHPGPEPETGADPHVRSLLVAGGGGVPCLWMVEADADDDGVTTRWTARPLGPAVVPSVGLPLWMRTALGELPALLNLVDDDGIVAWASPAYQSLLGFDIVGLKLGAWQHPADAHVLAADLAGLDSGQSRSFSRRRRLVTADGVTVWVQVTTVDLRSELGVMVTHGVDVTREVEDEARVAESALRDPLTHLWTRGPWLERVAEMARGTDGELRVACVDLRNFRALNDRHGMAVGDLVLVELGDRIAAAFGVEAVVGRLGGDRFGIAALGRPGHSEPLAATHLESLLRDPVRSGATVRVVPEAVVGLSSTEWGTPRVASMLLRDAEEAVSEARRTGRGWVNHDATLRARVGRRHSVHERLDETLRTGQIRPHFQPIVDPALGGIPVGAEALVRLNLRDGSPIPPPELVEAAVRSDTIGLLGDQVLAHAARAAARTEFGHVSVNVDGRQLLDTTFARRVFDILDAAGLPPERLVLELTETTASADSADPGVRQRLRHLTRLGIRLSLDDFGTGIAGLSLLQDLPFSIVKIDRRFVARLCSSSPRDEAMIRGMAGVCQAYGVTMIAEGVENECQQRVLDSIAPMLAQGYLYGRPAPEFPECGVAVAPEAKPGSQDRASARSKASTR